MKLLKNKVKKNKDENKESKNNKKIIIILVSIIVICLATIIFLLVKSKLDYNPLKIEPNAQEIKDDDKTKLTDDSTLNAVRLNYSTNVEISLTKKEVYINFKNPSASNQNMVLTIQIIDDNNEIEIAKSQSIPAGYSLNKLDLSKNVSLKKGSYKGQFVINYYKEGTNEKSMLDTKTPVTIEVK